MVECFLAKEDVAGSTPVSRSNNLNLNRLRLGSLDCTQRFGVFRPWGVWWSEATGRGTQVVRERSAKPLCVGSIPTRASNIISFIINSITHQISVLCSICACGCSREVRP